MCCFTKKIYKIYIIADYDIILGNVFLPALKIQSARHTYLVGI